MTKDLYVRNISAEATEEDVRKLFSVAGKVAYIHLVTDARTGESKGCGYVKMSSEAEAKEAITCLDGALLINRVIAVTEALPQRAAGAQKSTRPQKQARPQKPAGEEKRPPRQKPAEPQKGGDRRRSPQNRSGGRRK